MGRGRNQFSTDAKCHVQAADVEFMIAQAINKYKLEVNQEINELKVKLTEVENSQSFINAQYEDLKGDYDQLLKVNERQKDEIRLLKAQSTELVDNSIKEAEKLDAVEQYGRRQNLEIMGVPFNANEDTNQIAISVAKLVDVDLSPDQISTSHRLPTPTRRKYSNANDESQKPPQPPAIIVRFVNRDIRNRIYTNRKKARLADFAQFPVEGTQAVYINENLTRQRKKLFWKTKQQAKTCGYKFYWTINGNIFIRQDEDSPSIQIKSENDLAMIK